MTENIDQAANDNAPEVDETPTDWQAKYEAMRAHSREWEAKAKANKAAADELEQIKAAQMTEQEKLTARAEAAEAKLAELEARQAHDEAAKQIAKAEWISEKYSLSSAQDRSLISRLPAQAQDFRTTM